YGLGAIHAASAWQAGATGSGVTVAVIDSGVDHTQADLAVNVSPQSTDVFSSRNAPDGQDNHGTLVAGIIASAFNGFGTVGVAYNA
ncbi:S8 family serine peptidase, partial [Klebsiella aerogenes]|uniref:S8 family serine peptidase n=1 Tax=Klebsiella aerogenes TaxID=548 RepID=UPI001954F1A6